MSDKGVIRNKKAFRQVNSFAGLVRRRGIYPTDIDGLIDYNGRAFVFMEGKYIGTEMPLGQRKALQNVCCSLCLANRPSIVIVFEHASEFDNDVEVSGCIVREIFFNGKWHDPGFRTVIDVIEKFEEWAEASGLRL